MASRVMLAHQPKLLTVSQFAYLQKLTICIYTGRVFREDIEVGGVDAHGYVKVWVAGRVIKRAHIIWWKATGKWPSQLVDHRNRNREDDRYRNLRLATHSQNTINTDGGYKSKSGLPKGVSLNKGGGQNSYEVKLYRNKKVLFLGRYPTVEQASEAYQIGAYQFDNGKATKAPQLRASIHNCLEEKYSG